MLVQETLLGYKTQRCTRNAVRTLSSEGGGQGLKKKNLMKFSRVRVFFFSPPLNRSLMSSPIPNKFTQTLGFPSPIRIIQTHKQITFQNKNTAGYNLKTRKLNRSRHLSSFNESRQIKLLSRRYRDLQICTFLEQFLSSLHVFNLTTCNDHLEPTQIYPNTSKVHFVKGYANYIKICPQQF